MLFDINRQGVLAPMLRSSAGAMIDTLQPGESFAYRLTVVGNVDADSANVAERRREPGQREAVLRPLVYLYPSNVYSLSHVALPFPPDDPVYGIRPGSGRDGLPSLGSLLLRGEAGALTVSLGSLTRVRSNPFWPIIESQIEAMAAADIRSAGATLSPAAR